MSPQRTITYYYYPKSNVLSQAYEYVSVPRDSQSPTPSTPALSNATTRTNTPVSTPTLTMARPTTQRVGFASQVRTCRPPRDDELSVMRKFARHAEHCRQCKDPYRVWKEDGQLCDRGHGYARDVAKYIYSKGGRPCSIVDKESRDERNEIEVPVDCEVIRNLVKAFDRGLNLKTKPVVSHDRNYYVSDRKEQSNHDRESSRVVYVVPSDSRSRHERERYHSDDKSVRRQSTVDNKKGSLYYQDEADKKSRRRYDEPVIIIAEPRRHNR